MDANDRFEQYLGHVADGFAVHEAEGCRALACIGSTRAAMGSTLLRVSGSINPVQ